MRYVNQRIDIVLLEPSYPRSLADPIRRTLPPLLPCVAILFFRRGA